MGSRRTVDGCYHMLQAFFGVTRKAPDKVATQDVSSVPMAPASPAGSPPAGAAKLRRDVGETVEEASHFLDHSSFAVTTVYLKHLQGQKDKVRGKVAEAMGPS